MDVLQTIADAAETRHILTYRENRESMVNAGVWVQLRDAIRNLGPREFILPVGFDPNDLLR